MHIRKGDDVIINTGKDRGERGEVIQIDSAKNRVKVQRRNMITKHRKPNMITGAEGARVEVEGWLAASNVNLYSKKAEGGVRTQARYLGAKGELFAQKDAATKSFGDSAPKVIKKVRFAPKTGETFDVAGENK